MTVVFALIIINYYNKLYLDTIVLEIIISKKSLVNALRSVISVLSKTSFIFLCRILQ